MTKKAKATPEEIIDAMSTLVKLFQDPDKIRIPQEAIEEISKLEKLTEEIQARTEAFYKKHNIDKALLKEAQAAEGENLLLKKNEGVRQKAKENRKTAEKSLQERGERVKSKGLLSKKEQEAKQQSKERRKLYRTIGGDKKWIPL